MNELRLLSVSLQVYLFTFIKIVETFTSGMPFPAVEHTYRSDRNTKAGKLLFASAKLPVFTHNDKGDI